ncbi:MAG TPA: 3-phosphoshikimate 1-carboxyvinyltransferase, partial [Hyphomicrobium sp.]|nr:3-phosphoshikimate 1-carboxyvinyltransferase [Hyphomicrobium sp.]
MTHADPSPLTSVRSVALKGRLRVPGDKSISHRALMLGAVAAGKTRIRGLLESEDVVNTARAVTALGAPAAKSGDVWEVLGRGTGGLKQPDGPLDFGNSGTGTRLMMGLLAPHDITVTMTGDASLSKRPMARVLGPLKQMGLEVDEDRDRLPLTMRGTSRLTPLVYTLPVPSAQVKSAILLAGLGTAGETTVIEREATRDHTERMLRHFGAEVTSITNGGETRITIKGEPELQGREVMVPGDPSSAAFLIAAALIAPGSEVTIEGVLVNPTRTGFYTTLKEMGGDVEFLNEREECGEPIADIRARYSALSGVVVPAERAPSMIDEYPMLAVVAAFARGATRMDGLAELKVKESDRLAAMVEGLQSCGISARAEGDTLTVRGGHARPSNGAPIAVNLDHRIAMSFLVLGM